MYRIEIADNGVLYYVRDEEDFICKIAWSEEEAKELMKGMSRE